MRSLQRKFIGASSFARSATSSPRKAAVNELVWLKPIVNPISVTEDAASGFVVSQ